jgi:hypothetical protein
MTAILDTRVGQVPIGERLSPAPRPTAQPTTVVHRGPVVALRQRPAIALGCLAERSIVTGDRLVTAHDEVGQAWWIPADAVWSDAERRGYPEHPRPIGLATAASREAALIKGLSDRLGWEAVLEFERGHDLPVASELAESVGPNTVVLDGRLDHDVPTVVVLGSETVRWGAACSWDGAMQRALYGDDASVDVAEEFAELCALLGKSELAIAAVDLDTPLLNSAGIVRCSVQIVAGNASVRAWDANLVN